MRAYSVKVQVQNERYNVHTIATHDLLHKFLRGMFNDEPWINADTNVQVNIVEVEHAEINTPLDIELVIEANY